MAKDKSVKAVAEPVEPVVLDDLRRILGLEVDAPVPEKVLGMYRTYKKRVDMCSAGKIGPKELILLTVLAGCQDPVVTDAPGPDKVETSVAVSKMAGAKEEVF